MGRNLTDTAAFKAMPEVLLQQGLCLGRFFWLMSGALLQVILSLLGRWKIDSVRGLSCALCLLLWQTQDYVLIRTPFKAHMI